MATILSFFLIIVWALVIAVSVVLFCILIARIAYMAIYVGSEMLNEVVNLFRRL